MCITPIGLPAIGRLLSEVSTVVVLAAITPAVISAVIVAVIAAVIAAVVTAVVCSTSAITSVTTIAVRPPNPIIVVHGTLIAAVTITPRIAVVGWSTGIAGVLVYTASVRSLIPVVGTLARYVGGGHLNGLILRGLDGGLPLVGYLLIKQLHSRLAQHMAASNLHP